MPLRQIPLISDQGIWKYKDVAGIDAMHPYFLNGYFEKTDSPHSESYKFAFVKRPGFGSTLITGFTANHRIQGMSSSFDGRTMVLYTNTGSGTAKAWSWDHTSGTLTDRGTPPAAAGAWTNSRPVVFTTLDGISYGSGGYWAVTDFVKGAIISSVGVWTEITDADYTVLTKLTNIAALNGYLFQGASGNRIYNSDLNTPSSWVSTSFILAADYPGALVWLARVRNYLIAFKENSVEFFEDVGNPTPGSPLESRKQLNRPIGCVNKSTIQEVSDGIIFVGRGGAGALPRVYKLSKGDLSINEISNRYVEQCLTNVYLSPYPTPNYTVDSFVEGTPSSTSFQGQSMVFNTHGKEFYCITLGEPRITGHQRYTQVYDNNLKMWTTWASFYASSSTPDVYGMIPSQAQQLTTTSSGPVFASTVFANNMNAASTGARVDYVTDSADVWFDHASFNYNFVCVTEPLDFGSNKRKFLDSLEVIYDCRSDGTPTAGASTTLTIKYRDHDYATVAAHMVTRTLYVDAQRGTRCILRRGGSFRRRNFTIIHADSTPMRIWGLEAQYNQGETDQEG